VARVRGALDVGDDVGDAAARLRERLLQLGLVVDVRRARVLDPVGEGGDDRRRDRLVPVLEVEGCDRGLEQRGRDVAALDDPAELLVGDVARQLREPLAEPQLARDGGAALARDDVRADLREPPLGGVRVPVVQLLRDRELEDAVAQELEALVGGGAVGRPGRVREDVLEPLARQPLDQRAEPAGIAGRRGAATGAWRRSRRPARRS
jgi:hypothetical protein